jgi:SAM-dependent methyltransferase
MDQAVYERMAVQEERHWWFLGRRAILERVVGTMDLPEGAQILEVGAGTGGNLGWLSEHGAVDAFEYDEEARKIAEKKAGIPVPFGALPDQIPYPDSQYDLIVSFDVFEHVEKDAESFGAVKKKLKPGGRLLLTVPAHPFLWGAHDETHHHFRRYRKAELASKIQAAGLELSWISYYNFWLFPPIAGVRLAKRAIKAKHSDEAGSSEGAVPKVLQKLFASEAAHLAARKTYPWGVSLIAEARRM